MKKLINKFLFIPEILDVKHRNFHVSDYKILFKGKHIGSIGGKQPHNIMFKTKNYDDWKWTMIGKESFDMEEAQDFLKNNITTILNEYRDSFYLGNHLENNIRTYDISEIQTVYKQHNDNCGTVLYSADDGITWRSVGMDSGKWDITNWLFAFIK